MTLKERWKVYIAHHGLHHIQYDVISPFRNSIMLWCSRRCSLWENLILFKIILKILAEVFISLIRSKYLDTLSNFYFNFIFEVFQPFKYTWPCPIWSLTMKRVYSFMTKIIISPHTSVYIRPNNVLDLSLF